MIIQRLTYISTLHNGQRWSFFRWVTMQPVWKECPHCDIQLVIPHSSRHTQQMFSFIISQNAPLSSLSAGCIASKYLVSNVQDLRPFSTERSAPRTMRCNFFSMDFRVSGFLSVPPRKVVCHLTSNCVVLIMFLPISAEMTVSMRWWFNRCSRSRRTAWNIGSFDRMTMVVLYSIPLNHGVV